MQEEGEDTDSEGEVEGLMEEREAFGAERAASVAGQPDGALALMHRGPSPVQRAAAGALLRAALGGGAGAELLAAGLLLSELGPPRQPPVALGRARLSLSVEVAGLTKAVLVDSPDNQEAAAAAQLVPSLVKVGRGVGGVRSTQGQGRVRAGGGKSCCWICGLLGVAHQG